jgi:hypothetical protein
MEPVVAPQQAGNIGFADTGHAEQGDFFVVPGAEGFGAEFHWLDAGLQEVRQFARVWLFGECVDQMRTDCI